MDESSLNPTIQIRSIPMDFDFDTNYNDADLSQTLNVDKVNSSQNSSSIWTPTSFRLNPIILIRSIPTTAMTDHLPHHGHCSFKPTIPTWFIPTVYVREVYRKW